MVPAVGADEAVKFCGGLLAVLLAAGVDTGVAIPCPERTEAAIADSSEAAAADETPEDTVFFPLATYDRLKAALMAQQQAGLSLLGPAAVIPDKTLGALR